MPNKYTLLTGGLGFIGSHTAVELSQQQKPIILVDNLSNSNLDVFFKIQRLTTCDVIFYQSDILDTDKTIKQVISDFSSKNTFKVIEYNLVVLGS